MFRHDTSDRERTNTAAVKHLKAILLSWYNNNPWIMISRLFSASVLKLFFVQLNKVRCQSRRDKWAELPGVYVNGTRWKKQHLPLLERPASVFLEEVKTEVGNVFTCPTIFFIIFTPLRSYFVSLLILTLVILSLSVSVSFKAKQDHLWVGMQDVRVTGWFPNHSLLHI